MCPDSCTNLRLNMQLVVGLLAVNRVLVEHMVPIQDKTMGCILSVFPPPQLLPGLFKLLLLKWKCWAECSTEKGRREMLGNRNPCPSTGLSSPFQASLLILDTSTPILLPGQVLQRFIRRSGSHDREKGKCSQHTPRSMGFLPAALGAKDG